MSDLHNTIPPRPSRLAAIWDSPMGYSFRRNPVAIVSFLIFALIVIVASWLASQAGLEVKHPTTGDTVRAVNLLSLEGLHRILANLVTNFTGVAATKDTGAPDAPPVLRHRPHG